MKRENYSPWPISGDGLMVFRTPADSTGTTRVRGLALSAEPPTDAAGLDNAGTPRFHRVASESRRGLMRLVQQ